MISTWNGVHNMFWETRMGVNNRKKWMIMEDIYLGSMVGMKYVFFSMILYGFESHWTPRSHGFRTFICPMKLVDAVKCGATYPEILKQTHRGKHM